MVISSTSVPILSSSPRNVRLKEPVDEASWLVWFASYRTFMLHYEESLRGYTYLKGDA